MEDAYEKQIRVNEEAAINNESYTVDGEACLQRLLNYQLCDIRQYL